MVHIKKFLKTYSGEDKKRAISLIEKLLRCLPADKIIIIGGVSIQYHLASRGILYPSREFKDLDIRFEGKLKAIPTSITKDFLIYHLHTNNALFYLAIVDPLIKAKIDIFFDGLPTLKTIKVRLKNHLIRARSLEDQLAQHVLLLQKIVRNRKIDPKLLQDTRLMLKVADLKLANQIWRIKSKNKLSSFELAFKKAEKMAKDHPELLKKDPYRKSKLFQCTECRETTGYPITPPAKIYKILKW